YGVTTYSAPSGTVMTGTASAQARPDLQSPHLLPGLGEQRRLSICAYAITRGKPALSQPNWKQLRIESQADVGPQKQARHQPRVGVRAGRLQPRFGKDVVEEERLGSVWVPAEESTFVDDRKLWKWRVRSEPMVVGDQLV